MRRPDELVSLLPTSEPTRDDLLFFAGFYEGEGSVQGRHGACTMQLVQKDTELLHRGRSLWGGSIHLNNRGISSWILAGDRARSFLIAIYPYLSNRRKAQIEAAGGLVLSGKKTLDFTGMTQERRLARSAMSEIEKHSDSCINWAKNNPEKSKEILKRYRDRNRDRINARQRERRAQQRLKSYTSNLESLERSQLVN